MTILFDSALKASVVIIAALLVAALFRRRSPAMRHWTLSVAVLCAALMPFAAWILPAWNMTAATTIPAFSRAVAVEGLMAATSVAQARTATPPASVDPEQAFAMVWLAGSGLALMVLAIGFVRLVRVAGTCDRVTEGDWVRIADAVSQRYGLSRRVRLLRSRSSSMLVTWGTLRPTVLLPQGSELWGEDRINVVLHHELAHVRRNDWLLHTLAEILRVAYWFNPLIWVVCRRLRLESEYAADDAVLAHGISGPRYATHLLDIVRELHQPEHSWSAASAMARPSTIERRFSAMLNSTADRRPMGRLAMAALAMLLLLVSLPLAALTTEAPPPVVVWEAPVVPPPVAVELPTASPVAAAPARVQQTPQPTPPVAATYTGEKVSFDLTNTDIRDFFRLIGDISGLNVVLDPEVKGDITIVLKEIPWDQALDVVIKNYNLSGVLDGSVLRITKTVGIPQGRIVLDFEVLKNGMVIGQPRIGTVGKISATLNQGNAFTITVIPTQVAANKVELDLEFVAGAEKFAGKGLALSKESPGSVIWQTAAGSYEIRFRLVAP